MDDIARKISPSYFVGQAFGAGLFWQRIRIIRYLMPYLKWAKFIMRHK